MRRRIRRNTTPETRKADGLRLGYFISRALDRILLIIGASHLAARQRMQKELQSIKPLLHS